MPKMFIKEEKYNVASEQQRASGGTLHELFHRGAIPDEEILPNGAVSRPDGYAHDLVV